MTLFSVYVTAFVVTVIYRISTIIIYLKDSASFIIGNKWPKKMIKLITLQLSNKLYNKDFIIINSS